MNQKTPINFFLLFLFLSVLAGPPLYAAELVNINTASLAELETLPGVGPSIAQSIIDNRPYAAIEEVSRASGIGEPGSSSYEKIKNLITVGSTSATQTTTATSSTQTQAQTSPSAPVSSFVAPPVPEVFADAGDNRTVIVGADVLFDGRAYNRQKEIITNVRFLWNFGDGAVAEGAAVMHHFEYPGRYAVVLTIAEDRSASVDQIVVLAEPANLAFFTIQDGGVRIENRAGRDLDLSRWIVRQFGRNFSLPEHSVILAGSSMFISQKTLGFYSGPSVEFDYPNGTTALRAGESAGGASTAVVQSVVVPAVPKTPSAPIVSKTSAPRDEPGEVLGTNTSAFAPVNDKKSSSLWLSLGALAVLLAGGAGTVHYLGLSAKRSETPPTAGGFDIVD